MLVSPHFLFRIERDPNPDPTRAHKITDLELASRLSYFLWSSMPDDELLSLAEAGKLRAPGVLDAQVKRMLADERSAALADNFAGQWLETRNLDSVKPDPQKFPEWGPELRDAMKTETRMFFEAIAAREPAALRVPGCEVHVPERTAGEALRHRRRDRSGVSPGGLTTDQRGGILSHASVLTVSSYPTRTSPVIRGKYVLQNILGAPPPPPPPDVPALDEEAVGNAGSLRQQLEKHRTNADVRVLPQPHGRARLRSGELRRHRQVAHDGRQVPGRLQRHAAERQVVRQPGGDADSAQRRPA